MPALALVDLDLPDGSGVTLIETLARGPSPRKHPIRPMLIVTTVFGDDRRKPQRYPVVSRG